MALYRRAKVYIALEQLDKALIDIDRVVVLKPKWAKVKNDFLKIKKILGIFIGLLLSK
jgi:hypothetical protein